MLKSIVLCVFLWHEMCQFSSHAHPGLTDTRIENSPAVVSPKINNSDVQIEPRVIYNFNITFYVNGPLLGNSGFDHKFNSTDNTSRAGPSREACDRSQGASPQARQNQSEATASITPWNIPRPGTYIVTHGIGAHTVHNENRTWTEARQICINEGGDLAVIRSEEEEELVMKMLYDAKQPTGWIGFHQQLGTQNWTSVFGEPLGESGWNHWNELLIDSHGPMSSNRHRGAPTCAEMWWRGGMIANRCNATDGFVCKVKDF